MAQHTNDGIFSELTVAGSKSTADTYTKKKSQSCYKVFVLKIKKNYIKLKTKVVFKLKTTHYRVAMQSLA